MIRDADKIDIYNVITKSYIQHRDDPDNFKLEIELPDLPELFARGHRRDYDGPAHRLQKPALLERYETLLAWLGL